MTEEGTVFHAGPTAPQGFYFETRIRLFDMLWQCMARACPDRLPAGSYATIFATVIAPDTGRKFAMVEPQMGGWSATNDRDRMDAMYSSNHSDTFSCPVEICEALYGLNVITKGLADALPSPSGHRGGRGVSVVYELRGNASFLVGHTRAKMLVWALTDQAADGVNSMKINRATGAQEAHQFASGVA